MKSLPFASFAFLTPMPSFFTEWHQRAQIRGAANPSPGAAPGSTASSPRSWPSTASKISESGRPFAMANNGGYAATVIAQSICIGVPISACSTILDTDGDGIKTAFDNCIGGANAAIAGPPAYAQSQRDLTA